MRHFLERFECESVARCSFLLRAPGDEANITQDHCLKQLVAGANKAGKGGKKREKCKRWEKVVKRRGKVEKGGNRWWLT